MKTALVSLKKKSKTLSEDALAFINEYLDDAKFSENTLLDLNNTLFDKCEAYSAVVPVKKLPAFVVAPGVYEKNEEVSNMTTALPGTLKTGIHSALSFKNTSGAAPQPVIIDGCSNFMTDGGAPDGYKMRREKDGKISNAIQNEIYFKRCTAHSMLVIGRRSNGGKCELLVRNTTGTCKGAGYSKKWKCDANGKDVWVDDAVVAENILNYTQLQDQ